MVAPQPSSWRLSGASGPAHFLPLWLRRPRRRRHPAWCVRFALAPAGSAASFRAHVLQQVPHSHTGNHTVAQVLRLTRLSPVAASALAPGAPLPPSPLPPAPSSAARLQRQYASTPAHQHASTPATSHRALAPAQLTLFRRPRRSQHPSKASHRARRRRRWPARARIRTILITLLTLPQERIHRIGNASASLGLLLARRPLGLRHQRAHVGLALGRRRYARSPRSNSSTSSPVASASSRSLSAAATLLPTTTISLNS